MTFSIIIPTYNAERFLQPCIESILSQDYTDYEIFCIDDGSADSTPHLLYTLSQQHTNIHTLSIPHSGPASARNRALGLCTGEYILFADSDDLFPEHALSTLAEHLGGSEDIICFNAALTDEDLRPLPNEPNITEEETGDAWTYFCRNRLRPKPIHFVCIWQRAYRRKFLIEENLLFEEGLRRAEDDLFTTRLFLRAKSLRALPHTLYTHRSHPSGISRSTDRSLWEDSLRTQRLIAEEVVPLEGKDKEAIYKVLASDLIGLFTTETLRLYHPSAALLSSTARSPLFRTVCITPRHRYLRTLIRIHPALFRLYMAAAKKMGRGRKQRS